MANSAVGAIDIISRQNGALISEVAGNQSVVALNGLSIVRIHGTADSVASYERQGNDLILHMKDGTTVRYQHFFTADAEGNYSELVFDDGVNPPVHATFPTAVGAAAGVDAILVPQLTAIDSVAGLALGGSASSAGLLAGALGFLAIAGGIGIAASHNSNGNSGSGNIDPPPVTGGNPRPAPTLTVNPLTGDNRLNGSEVNSNQTLSGTTTGVAAGQLVNVTINGTTYTAKVQADGSWSVLLPAGVLQGLHDGSYPVVVTVANGSGQTAQQTVTLVVDTTAPTLTLSPVAGDGIINAAEAKATVVIGGTSSAIGATITVVFNGKTYTGTVQSDGRWSVDVPASALVGLKDGSQSISATVSNSAGNSASASGSVMIDADPLNFPALFVNSFASDNHLNGAEQKVSQTLSGATTHVEAGRLVLITLNNKTYSATVGADGKWSTQIPPADLAMLANGSATVHVEVTNAAGNPASKDSVFTVDNTQGGLGINPVSGDNLINANEAQTDLTVTGTSAGLAVNTAVKVTLNGVTYNGTVDANGNWSVLIPKGDLGKLTDGPITLTVEAAGLPDATLPLGIYINNLPAATFSTPFGDGNLNGTEAKIDQTLQGSTGVNGAGQTVTVSFNGVTYHPVVALDGSWSLVFPSAVLQMLGQGNTPLLVTVSDIAGNSKSQLLTVNVDTQAPTLTVNPVAGDGTINAIEAAAPITLSGRSSEIGATVVITYEGKTYQAIVQTDGSWHVDIPAGALTGIADGSHPLTATVVDAAGNITNVTSNVTLDANPVNLPTLSINTFAGNNILDAAEQRVDQIVSGTTTQVESGRVVTILLNGKTYQATVGADGSWSVKVSAADLALLLNGNASITATVADASGNSTTETHNITVNDKLTGLGINPVTGDNLINAAEAAAGVTVSGTSFNVNAGQTITLTLNGKIYTAQVGADGRWSAQIPAADLAQLADGSAVLTASTTDAGGNPINSSANLGIYTHTLPTASLAPPFGDGTLNSTEAALGQTLTGSTGVTGNGQKVSVTLGGVTYAATVAADGSWSLQLPANALQGLGQGNQSLAITASDAAGNSNTLNTQFKVDTQAPTLTVAPIATDNIINGTEAATSITVRGTSSEIGAIVKVSIGGQLYSGAVQPDGSWSVTIPAGALSSLGDGRYVVSTQVQDAAGNSTTLTQDVMLDADPRNFPTLSINAFADNNILDGAEQKVSQTVSGSTTGIEAGRTITISLNGKTYSATVDSAGKWSTTIPAGDLALLTNGTTNITATVSDVNGNAANGSHTIIVNNTQSGIGISPLTGDNLINAQEAAAGITVNGTSSNLNANQTITVTLNGKTYTTTTGSNGNWSLALPAGDLALLADGSYPITISIQDSAGNTTTVTENIKLVTQSVPNPTLTTPFADGYLNATEVTSSQTLSGSTGVSGAGQQVVVTVGGVVHTLVADSQGNWQLTLQPSELQNLPNGNLVISVTATDSAGNSNSYTGSATVDKIAPALVVNPISNDNIINAIEALSTVNITGNAPQSEAGRTVSVQLNGVTYSSLVQPDGTWSIPLSNSVLQGLADGNYPVRVTISDSAGNQTTVDRTLTIDASPVNLPTVTISSVSGDNFISRVESTKDVLINGVSSHVEAGRTVSVMLNGKTYSGTVQSDGNWQVTVPAADVSKLPEGALTAQATVTDVAGNPASDTHQVTVIASLADQPVLTVSTVTSDDIINYQESQSALTISGNSQRVQAGQTVTVSLHSKNYQGVVQADGSWSVSVPAGDAQALPQGNNVINATVNDVAQNPASSTHNVTVDTQAPLLTVDVQTNLDNVLNLADALLGLVVKGTCAGEAGLTVTVTLNGHNYKTQVQSDGSWSLTIPSADLLLLGDGPLAGGVKVSVTDAAGNESHDITNLNVAINALPTLTLAPLFGDNILSVGEISANATLTGSCSNLAVGTAVVVSIGGKNYSGSVTSNGVWSVNISAAALQSLNDGMTKVTVSATDADSGNKASASVDLDILIHNVPNITLPALPFGDGYLNKLEAAASQILTGNTGATGSGQTITLKIDGVTYPATVALDGTWICALPAGALNGLTDGSHTISITVTDRVGNSDTESVTFNSALNISPAPTFDVGPIIGGILNAAEAAAGGQLTGSTGIVGDKLQQVTVTINGTGYAATVTADGKWTLTLSPDVLQALPEGTWDVTVTAKDAAGNSGSLTSQVEVLTHNLPHPTLVLPFGDGVLNHAEALLGQTLSGSTGVTGVGQQVAISIDGKFVQTITANPDGSWSLPLLTGLLAGLANGPHTIGIKVTDRGGNEVTISPEITFTSQQQVPTPSIDTLSFGASINIAEAALATTISGKTGITGNNQNVQLKIDVGGISYSGVVDANTGNWTVTIPAGSLNGLTNGQHQINVTVTDSAGNSSSQSANFDSFLTLPAPTISTPLFGATLNLAEAGTDQLLTGTTGLLNTAQTVKVTINGVVYNANVNIATGAWSVTVPTADLKQIPDGAQQPIRVDVTDGGGNSGSNSLNIGVVTHNLPTVTVDAPLFGAELDFAESKIPQLLSGSTTNIAQGSLVNISFGTLNLTAIVGADGKWSALVNSAQLGTLSGSAAISATVTDSAGNEGHTTNPINVNVNLSPPAVVLTINPIATDNIINATDDPLSITISGKVMGAGALGGTVLVSINGIPQIAPIVFGADGNWSVTLPKLSFPDGNYQITASVVGGTASEQVGLLVDRSPPTLTLSPFADNNILDALESKSPQLVSGVASTDDIGRTVTVTLNGKNYSALIGAQGQWSVSIPTADLQVLAQGSHTLKVTLTDLAGNPAEKTATIVVDTIPALITLDVAAPILNSNVLGSILSGTALGAEGKTLTLTLGSTILTTVVGNDGKWSITVLPGNLSGIVDGPLVAGLSVTDTAGNPSSSNVTVNVALNPALALTVDPLFNGGYLNAIGALVDQTLSGTVLNAGLGAKVKVTINGHEQIAEVGANGKWTLTLPAADLSQLADGALTLNISVTDANNNVVQLLPAPVLNVLTHNLPAFGALDPLFGGDGILNGVESALTQTLGGVINNVAAGATVTVTIGTQVLTTQVQAGGVWHVDLLPSLLGGLQDGSLQVGISVKDVAGNIVNTQVGITVLTHDLPLVTLNPIFGDGILNAADLLLNQTISGTVNNMPAGAEVTIKLGTALLKAIIGADGSFTVPVDSLTLNGLLAGSLNVTASVTDSAGNTNTATRPLLVDVTLPVISLNPVFDDGKLSLADTAIAQIIGGTVSGVEAGTQVKVTLGGKTFFGTTTANGSFTIAVQPTDLTALLNGNLTVGVSVTDSAGNTGTTSGSVNVIINNVPKLILNPIFGDGLLSIDDSKATQIISGTVVNGTVGAQVLVQVGSNQLTAIVGTGGGWSVQVPSNILSGLLDGSQTISASLVDSAGNATSANGLVNVLIHAQPTLSVNPIFGDGILSVADLLVAQTISGTTTNVALGTQINVVLNGKPYTATVGAGGNWSVLIQPVDLKTLVTDGPLTVNVSLQDAVGNQANTSGALSVIANALPTLSLDPVFGDGLLNAADALLTQTISGHSTSAAGANVTVKVGNLTLNTIVKADGSWSIAVPPSALAGLLDGSFTASANLTNAAGHSASATAPVTVGISLPTLTLNPFFASDSYLSGAESTTAQVISGTSTHAAGSQITVTVGGAVLTGIIGSDGHWSVPITPSALTGLLDGSAKIGVSVTDAVGNHVAVNTDFTVKTHALPLLGVDALGNVGNLLQLPTNGLIVSGSSLNVLANTKVKVTLLGQTLEGTVDSSGHWSVQFFGSFLKALNVVSILTTPVAVSVTDEAGNYKAISVGLLSGSGIQLLSADHDIQATSMMVTHDTDTSHLVEPLAQPIDSILTTTVTEGGYTIGGVTLNLADGVVMSGEALTGSSGADVFTVNSLNFNHIDGGLGMDTLLLGGVNQTLDLTHLGLKVEHIEIIDLGQSGSNSIRLDLQDALTLTDKPEDDLLIKGAQGGQVTLSNTPDGVWSSVGQRSIDGQAFDVYHNSSLDSSNTLGDVLIQHGLQVHLV
ncbi:TPA: Ig-like domain-containing protein [Yersinia enterocolitica]|nr:Ig-like domain-containing protein [Yersinia enterocolitica]